MTYIQINKVEKFENIVLIKFSCSDSIKKYFNEKEIFVEYDFNIDLIPDYILTIPALSNIIQVAWFTNSNVYIKDIDHTLLKALNNIREIFKKNFKNLDFSSIIQYENLKYEAFGENGIIQLFSGGLDSTATCIKNIKTKSTLAIIDFEPAGIHKDIINWAKNIYGNGTVARTNIYSFLNRKKLDNDFGTYTDGSWWGGVQHGMGLIGLTAPITYHLKSKIIYIASTHDDTFKDSWGSDPKTDNLMCWSNLKVSHQDYNFSRQDKLKKIIKPYVIENSFYPPLLVCNSYARKKNEYNCSKCAKCAQCIVALAIEELDPRKFGFNVTNKTFLWIKESLDTLTYFGRKSDFWTWQNAHKNIPKNVDDMKEFIPGTLTFLKWFSELNFKYDDYFNNTTVMRDRPGYKIKYVDSKPELTYEK